MKTIEKIYNSHWWEKAKTYPDRHYPADSGVMLSDHLSSVMSNVEKIFQNDLKNEYYGHLKNFLSQTEFDLEKSLFLLKVTALIHDIAKPIDNKAELIEHPFKKSMVAKRHQVLGVYAAMEMLEQETDLHENEKQFIYRLIDDHDTPYAWYRQFERTKVAPEFKSWKKLDQKICEGDDQYGIIMLALFKIADIDGHDSLADVTWFAEMLNSKYLNSFGKHFPVPMEEHIR